MKKISLFIIMAFACVYANAQFVGSKWKATLQFDSPTDVIFDFKTDTVEAIAAADNSSIEIMHYTIQDTVLTLLKISGQSQCDDTVTGKYKFEMKDGGVILTMIEDACNDRAYALDNSKWMKQ